MHSADLIINGHIWELLPLQFEFLHVSMHDLRGDCQTCSGASGITFITFNLQNSMKVSHLKT
jgi:hypothetical protein